eukprot:s378_g33.t1
MTITKKHTAHQKAEERRLHESKLLQSLMALNFPRAKAHSILAFPKQTQILPSSSRCRCPVISSHGALVIIPGMHIPLVAALCAVTISVSNASEDATWIGQRKALLRQEFSSISAATANSRNRDHLKKVEHDSVQASLRQPAADSIKAELQLAAKDLQISPDETAQVVSASQAVVPPTPEATNTSLTDSVVLAAEMLGLSSQQVDHLKVAMANLDHRSYVHILQLLRAGTKAATTAATLSVPAKVAAVVTAAAKANYSAEEVGAAAAAASLSLADDAASTTVPLQGLADAVGQLGVEGQAAVVSAAGGESWRSQSMIAEMFKAISSTTPVFQWDSTNAHPFGLDPQIVGDAVKDEMENLDIPQQEKMEIVTAAVNAAAAAERPNLRMNGTEGLDSNLAGDLLALASAAFSAGFTDQEVAIFKMKWQEMTSQQRAVAKRSFDALSSARLVAGLRNLGQGNLSTNVASAVKAFEDAGAFANDAAHVAADVLRATRASNSGADLSTATVTPLKDKTALQKTVENVKSARLSDQQAQAILKVMAGFSPADMTPVATAWAAIGGKIPAASTTQAPFPLQEERETGQPRLNAPTAAMDLQAGIDLDLVDRADRIAKGMSPTEQMTAAADIIRLPQRMSQHEGHAPQVEKEIWDDKHRHRSTNKLLKTWEKRQLENMSVILRDAGSASEQSGSSEFDAFREVSYIDENFAQDTGASGSSQSRTDERPEETTFESLPGYVKLACNPCLFYNSPYGCNQGDRCGFCHHAAEQPAGPQSRPRKVRRDRCKRRLQNLVALLKQDQASESCPFANAI